MLIITHPSPRKNEKVLDFLNETIKAAKYSALQILKRTGNDFKQPVKKIEITSGDFHNNIVP